MLVALECGGAGGAEDEVAVAVARGVPVPAAGAGADCAGAGFASGEGEGGGALTSRPRLTSQRDSCLTSGLGGASQVAGGVGLDGGAHEGAEGGAFGFGAGLGGVPDVVFDPGCPLGCWHRFIIPRQGPGGPWMNLTVAGLADDRADMAAWPERPAITRSD